jgi:hypothetical protein
MLVLIVPSPFTSLGFHTFNGSHIICLSGRRSSERRDVGRRAPLMAKKKLIQMMWSVKPRDLRFSRQTSLPSKCIMRYCWSGTSESARREQLTYFQSCCNDDLLDMSILEVEGMSVDDCCKDDSFNQAQLSVR